MCYCMCNDVIHASRGACTQTSRPPLYKCGVPEITYGHAVHASQMIFIKNNSFTFYHPKYKYCKPEHAKKDSHFHAQQEHGQLQ